MPACHTYGLPSIVILSFLCFLLLVNRKLMREYQNTLTFITFGCFFTATPIIWYNVVIFIGMEITKGNVNMSILTCSFNKLLTRSLWFGSFIVPSIISFNRYLLIVHNIGSSIHFSCFLLVILYSPMFIVDSFNLLFGVPVLSETCLKLLLLNSPLISELYTLYVFFISGSGVIFGFLASRKMLGIRATASQTSERQVARAIYMQTWIAFLAITFFVLSNLRMFTNLYSLPIWFSRSTNIYAVIGGPLLIPLIALFMVGKIRNAAAELFCLDGLLSRDQIYSETPTTRPTPRQRLKSVIKIMT